METLLGLSGVKLYGRVLVDLIIEQDGKHPEGPGNNFLQELVADKDAKFARIYAFVFETQYYEFPRPIIMLVKGDGDDPVRDERAGKGARRTARSPTSPDLTGVAAQHYQFAEGIKVWSYDKNDFSIVMDVETGPIEQILLASLSDSDIAHFRGAKVSGAKVGGGRVGGGRVGGGRVGGGRVGGGRVGGGGEE